MYSPKVIKPRFHWPTMALTIVVCAAVAVGAYWALHSRPTTPMPAAVRSRVHFLVFLPTREVTIDTTSYKYDTQLGVLSFTGKLLGGQRVTFAEQATPQPFNDIPNYAGQFLQTLHEYQAKDGLNGTIHLTHPKGAGQAVVLNSKGTLVFARVARDESADTWQTVFNDLQIY